MEENSPKAINFRIINQNNLSIPCYFYGYFKSPGLISYPDLPWVNSDFNLIKSKNLSEQDCLRIANNFFDLMKKFNLLAKLDYFVMMPLKSTSVSSLNKVILTLIEIIKVKMNVEIKFIVDLFLVTDYRKFWENRLKINERKIEIANKINLKDSYHHFFDSKNIIIIDDVVSTGTSIIEVVSLLNAFNKNLNVTALTYGSVYQWEKIYS